MKQPNRLDRYFYQVCPGEEVAFVIVEHDTERLITLSLDGQKLEDPFRMQVTKPAGRRHFVETKFEFNPVGSEEAWYEITLRGSRNGEFSVPPVRKRSAVKDPGFTFEVIQC